MKLFDFHQTFDWISEEVGFNGNGVFWCSVLANGEGNTVDLDEWLEAEASSFPDLHRQMKAYRL